MKLFIENTGLHAVGRCLAGEAKGESDDANLLQFATQIVFSDAIYYCAFASTGVGSRSAAITEQLSKIGVTDDVLRLRSLNVDAFDKVSLAAANRVAPDLKFKFGRPQSSRALIATSRAAAPDFNAVEQRFYDRVHRAIKTGASQARSALAAQGANAGLLGANGRLLSSSDSLWEEMHRLARRKSWKKVNTIALMAFVRSYLNEQLAMRLSEVDDDYIDYAPSVARARIIDAQQVYTLRKLSEAVGSAAQKLEGVTMKGPPVGIALALKGKGDPQGIISEALSARAKTTELRNHLRSIVDKARRRTGSANRREILNDLGKAVKRLQILVEQDLGVASPPTLADVLKATKLGLPPLPPTEKIAEWMAYTLKRRRVLVLSEFAKTLVNPVNDKFALQRLCAATRKKKRGTQNL